MYALPLRTEVRELVLVPREEQRFAAVAAVKSAADAEGPGDSLEKGQSVMLRHYAQRPEGQAATRHRSLLWRQDLPLARKASA